MDRTVTSSNVTGVAGEKPQATAFRSLADRHLDASYRLARAIVGPADAEDATHDAFITAWQRWATLRDPALFERWFHRILINTCRNHLRRTSRHRIRDISEGLTLAALDDDPARDERDALERGLARLGPDDRIILALRYDRDLTVDAIAGTLAIPSGTVKSRLHHALRRLEAALDASETIEVTR